jgi:ATP-dependent Clp protease ATP-binding subunit ClpA
MFERFTSEARGVLQRAQVEARDLRHNFIGTEHLLLGLAGTPAGAVLAGLGATPEVLRQGVVDLVGPADEPIGAKAPFTPRAKKVLELSLREALARSESSIRPEHLLLALLREGEGVAAHVLGEAGVTYESVQPRLAVDSSFVRPRRVWRRPWMGGPSFPPSLVGDATPGGTRIPLLAREAAGTGQVATQHYLIALLEEERGNAARILRALGVTKEAVAQKAEELGVAGTSDEVPQVDVDLGGEQHKLSTEQVQQLRDIVRRMVEGDDPAAGMA